MITTLPPTSVEVGPFVYAVNVDPAAHARVCRQENEPALSGHHDPIGLTISLDPEQHQSAARDSLLHEILHAVTCMSGLQEELGVDDDEKLVRRLSPLLLDVLRRNPTLVSWLTTIEGAPHGQG